jgi:NAD(P)-dependent dehydrogenase (short-subunit alcohol dehydrogenase family)
VAELAPAGTEDAAAAAAATAAGPVVLKADVPGLVHKTDAGGAELDLRTEADVRAAYRRLAERFGPRLRQVLVQPMITGGTEVIAGMTDDHMFGSLVVFGLGGVATDLLADPAVRLTPLTDTDADQLIRSLRSAPLLLGYRGQPRPTCRRCACCCCGSPSWPTTCPVTELDLNPVIARPGPSRGQ